MGDPGKPTRTTDSNLAIAHKDYDVRGGGEILAEELARTFDAPLYVGHDDPANHDAEQRLDVHEIAPDSRYHSLMDHGGALRALAHMLHWRDNAPHALNDYGTVITSGNEPLWWPSRDDQTVIAYTHSTPRWMYDLCHDVDGIIARTYNQLQRRLYEGRVRDPDLWVANSDLVARRIQKYWNIPPEQIRIVYPPVDTHNYHTDWAPTTDSYLYLGRLAEHKRVDELVRAFNELGSDYHLQIAGKGPDRERLEALADSHIEFLGFVSEERKRELMAAATAHVYPALNEDFGMVPVESMAAGTPVIGVNEGFTQYQIMDARNGYTHDRGTDALREAIRTFDSNGVTWSADRISEFASRFSVDAFQRGMTAAVEHAEAETRVDPPWSGVHDDDPATPTVPDGVAQSGGRE